MRLLVPVDRFEHKPRCSGHSCIRGKRHALEDGPWNFGNDLLVMEDFVADKTVDEYEFAYVPIWIRVSIFRWEE